MEDKWTDLLNKAKEINKIYPDWRKGQALFNVLYELEPEIADQIRGSIYDCFYDDEIPEFKLKVIKALVEMEFDDEPLTEEEIKGIEEGLREYAQGKFHTEEEVWGEPDKNKK